jgi:hypothetical protein
VMTLIAPCSCSFLLPMNLKGVNPGLGIWPKCRIRHPRASYCVLVYCAAGTKIHRVTSRQNVDFSVLINKYIHGPNGCKHLDIISYILLNRFKVFASIRTMISHFY